MRVDRIGRALTEASLARAEALANDLAGSGYLEFKPAEAQALTKSFLDIAENPRSSVKRVVRFFAPKEATPPVTRDWLKARERVHVDGVQVVYLTLRDPG